MDNLDVRNNGFNYPDYWYYEIGVNLIASNTKNKKPKISWREHQDNPIRESKYKECVINGDFEDGMAIILGKIWRGVNRGKYLAGIDIDNQKGIEEILPFFNVNTLKDLAQITIVEQHLDNPNKCHFYLIVEKPLIKRSGISGRNGLKDIPAIEAKSEGKHGIMFCAPSPHKDGHRYEIIGTKKPLVLSLDESQAFERHIDKIYDHYTFKDQTNSNKSYVNGKPLIKDMLQQDFEVYEDNNRHGALLRIMESFLAKYCSVMSEDEIRWLAWDWGQVHCKPPLDEKEFERQWKDAKKFIAEKQKKNQEDKYHEKDGDSFEIEFLSHIKERCIDIIYDQLNRLYAIINVNDHIECISIESKRFKSLMRKEILETKRKTISDEVLDRIVKTLQSEIAFDENVKRIDLSLRVAIAPNDNNVFYYDLTNQSWEIVKVDSKCWKKVKNNALPLFKRYERNCKPQVDPVKDKNNEKYFNQFLKLFNLRTDEDLLLLSVYIISLFVPNIPKAILVISGNGGGAKTTTFSLIKNIIDPSAIDTLSFSSNKNDLIQSLEHHYVNFFDNVSTISHEVSDILCRAVTGSGDIKRELYTTDEDFIYWFKRCIGINGINIATTRADLIDRSIILKVERIPEEKRMREEDIRERFERLRPYVLGYIFDILVKSLKYIEEHKEKAVVINPPRMADFAEWGETISRCMGNPENMFIKTYRKNIDDQNDEIIESIPVTMAVRVFMENKAEGWKGAPSQLLQLLGDIISQIDPDIRRSKYWPKAANRLTNKLNEHKYNLLKQGIEVITGEKNSEGNRIIEIRKTNHDKSIIGNRNSTSGSENTSSFFQSFINPYIHRNDNTDVFYCERCRMNGDIHFMKDHGCKSN